MTLQLEPTLLSLSHTFEQTCTVPSGNDDLRLEAFCRASFPTLLGSRRAVREAIKKGEVLLDGQTVEHTRKLREGNQVELRLPALSALAALCPNRCWPRIVYEDSTLAIIWKDKDVKSTGGWHTAENGARLCVKPSCEIDAFDERVKAVHRLDKPVAGLLILAKTSSCHRCLMSWLRQRAGISKVYRAIVWGDPSDRLGEPGYPATQLLLECIDETKPFRDWSFQIDYPIDHHYHMVVWWRDLALGRFWS